MGQPQANPNRCSHFPRPRNASVGGKAAGQLWRRSPNNRQNRLERTDNPVDAGGNAAFLQSPACLRVTL